MKIVPPHKIISREVKKDDLMRVNREAMKMAKMLSGTIGIYKNGGYALAHSQVEEKDPLRFFVMRDGVVYVNPEIIRHTAFEHQKDEGCLTFSHENCPEQIKVPRWNKVTVRYQVLTKSGLSPVIEENINGLLSQIFQHEIDHFNGFYIYDRAEKPYPKN